jgi:release factor glutamine methyltransferase
VQILGELSGKVTGDVIPAARTMAFGTLTIGYDKRVLVPRPWTAAQSTWAADLLRDAPDGPVLELCAGVGHIGLLAVVGTDRDLVMVDADEAACGQARANAAAARLRGRCEVRHGRVDEVIGPDERFAGVVADPPWVPSEGVDRFPEDPVTAIDGGSDGMVVAWTCLEVAAAHLLDGGWVLLQLGTLAQADALAERLAGDPALALGLQVAAVREHGDRGVLVHLTRAPA